MEAVDRCCSTGSSSSPHIHTASLSVSVSVCAPASPPCIRLQQYARDARKEYAELGSKDLSELKSFVKGLPKLLLLDRLSDLAVPVAEVVKQQVGLGGCEGGWVGGWLWVGAAWMSCGVCHFLAPHACADVSCAPLPALLPARCATTTAAAAAAPAVLPRPVEG